MNKSSLVGTKSQKRHVQNKVIAAQITIDISEKGYSWIFIYPYWIVVRNNVLAFYLICNTATISFLFHTIPFVCIEWLLEKMLCCSNFVQTRLWKVDPFPGTDFTLSISVHIVANYTFRHVWIVQICNNVEGVLGVTHTTTVKPLLEISTCLRANSLKTCPLNRESIVSGSF